MKKKVVFILGPTGSGKTSLAVELAKKYNGEIISADSRQIFVGLDIGTGKDLEEYGKIKYHLIDICVPEEKFTMFDWLKLARQKIDEIIGRGHLPIVVGGTGLYAKALYEGYAIENLKDQVSKTKYTREELDAMTVEQLNELMEKLKIPIENLDLKNPRRLIRAIEKHQEGIKTTKRKPNFERLLLAIDLYRDELYKRIDKRVDVRFTKQGMLEEVAGLLNSGVSEEWLRSLGLEYKIISEYLTQNFEFPMTNDQPISNDQIFKSEPFQQMTQELKWKTHGYARRQLTWLSKQPNLIWIKDKDQAHKLVEKFLN